MAHPAIQTGYSASKGGLGTVTAMVIEQPILTAQASNSTTKRNLLLCQSSLIQSKVGFNSSFIQEVS
jgi:hypothetical protein